MNKLVICSSRTHHQNTRRVADALGFELRAPVVTLDECSADLVEQADLIGFGSGVFWMDTDPQLVNFVRSLPSMSPRDAFVFTTSGLPGLPFRRPTKTLEIGLGEQGFHVVGAFNCRGVDTWGPFSLFGGVSKGRPDEADFAAARRFASQLS